MKRNPRQHLTAYNWKYLVIAQDEVWGFLNLLIEITNESCTKIKIKGQVHKAIASIREHPKIMTITKTKHMVKTSKHV